MLSAAKNLLLFDRQFWGNPKNWPHDPPGYVLLTRAFYEVGATSYRGKWVQPPQVNEPAEPEEPADGDEEEIWDKYELEDDRYEDACEKARADCQNMWANVARMIAEACETSVLVSAVRAKVGGEMNELEPHYWNSESFEARFFRCDISLTYPFAKSRVDRSHWNPRKPRQVFREAAGNERRFAPIRFQFIDREGIAPTRTPNTKPAGRNQSADSSGARKDICRSSQQPP
jgi:hypothetical protein